MKWIVRPPSVFLVGWTKNKWNTQPSFKGQFKWIDRLSISEMWIFSKKNQLVSNFSCDSYAWPIFIVENIFFRFLFLPLSMSIFHSFFGEYPNLKHSFKFKWSSVSAWYFVYSLIPALLAPGESKHVWLVWCLYLYSFWNWNEIFMQKELH